MTDDLNSELGSKLASWLQQDGWTANGIALPETEWALSARDARERVFVVVGQPADTSNNVIIQSAVSLDEGEARHAAQLVELPNLLWDLKFELLRAGLEFTGIADPLTRISMYQKIYFDSFQEIGRDTFLQRVASVRRGVLAVRWSLDRRGVT